MNLKPTFPGGASDLASRLLPFVGTARENARPTGFAFTLLSALILFFATGTRAETTNTLSKSEIEGRQVAQQLRNECPAEGVTNSAVLKIRDAKKQWREVPVRFQIAVLDAVTASWEAQYETTDTNRVQLTISHTINRPNHYQLATNGVLVDMGIGATDLAFAGSDFWLGDFGLEFLAWPEQKILKKEFHNNCATMILESKNPNPTANGYARVVSRIEEESGGVMEAQTYDASGRQVKDFRVKNMKKVNGHWQVELVIMENVQAGSRTRLEFDLKKP